MDNFDDFRRACARLGSQDVFFSVVSDMYFADYRPCFPELSAADLSISYCWITGEGRICGNLQSLLVSKRNFSGLQELKDILGQAERTTR